MFCVISFHPALALGTQRTPRVSAPEKVPPKTGFHLEIDFYMMYNISVVINIFQAGHCRLQQESGFFLCQLIVIYVTK
jgi:hypothetical protein